jgi:hypothetical protein
VHRRNLEILGIARDGHGQLVATTDMPLLSDEDRRELRPILRAYAVQQAALTRSRWWWGYDALRLVTAVVTLAVPVVALVAWIGVSGVLWSALAAYLLFGAVALLGHGVQQNRNVRPSVFATVAVIVTVGTAAAATFTAGGPFGWLWEGAALGLVAAVVLLVLAEIRLFGLIAIRTMVFLPLARRRAGWPLPPQLAAMHLLQLLDGLHRARATCRHPRYRRNFLRWMDRMIKYVQWELPKATADLRLGAAITADSRTRANQLAGRLRQFHVRLAHDHQLREYDWVSIETATLTMALTRGDWSWGKPEDEAAAVQHRAVRVLKRIVPSVVLLAAAIGLPYLPGVTASTTSLTGIQVGLGLAAALSLVPIEATYRENVMSAYVDATKRDSDT